jgi:hypothetical protein
MLTGKSRQIAIVILVAATLLVNFLANYLPFNGITTAEVSDALRIFFAPAGYVFAIWGVIYLGLIAFAFYQAQPEAKNAPWLDKTLPAFALASVANMVWLFMWHYQQITVSVLVMLVLLASLMAIYHQLEVGKYPVSAKSYWMVHAPFSLYLGWISVATIANISGALWSVNWNGFGVEAQMWTVIMIAVAGALGLLMLYKKRDVVFAAVIVWALFGIFWKFNDAVDLVAGAALMASLLLAGQAKLVLYEKYKKLIAE